MEGGIHVTNLADIATRASMGLLYVDASFPPSATSVSPWLNPRHVGVEWCRVGDLTPSRLGSLFTAESRSHHKTTPPRELTDAALGTLWTDVTSLGHRAVEAIFRHHDGASTSGAYTLDIPGHGSVLIDDLVPCVRRPSGGVSSSGSGELSPLWSLSPPDSLGDSLGEELWWPLVVKAYAKIAGSYEELTDAAGKGARGWGEGAPLPVPPVVNEGSSAAEVGFAHYASLLRWPRKHA